MSADELRKVIEDLKVEMNARENRHLERVRLLEVEVLRMQKKDAAPKEKYRDVFVVKKGFMAIQNYTGKQEEYDDWRFRASSFLCMEEGFKELLTWIEKCTKEPDKTDLDSWELEEEGRDAKMMNEQLYNFLTLNLKDKALALLKNLNMKSDVNGVVAWWRFNQECPALTGQRIQTLANAIFKPVRVKKYIDVTAAIEKRVRDICRFEEATGKIAPETKTFSLRQLVPEELDHLITSNSNTLKDYASVKAYVQEQVALRRDKKQSGSGPTPMEVDRLADKITELTKQEGTDENWSWGRSQEGDGGWHGDQECGPCGVNAMQPLREEDDEQGKLTDKLETLMSFMYNFKGKAKGGKRKEQRQRQSGNAMLALREVWTQGK